MNKSFFIVGAVFGFISGIICGLVTLGFFGDVFLAVTIGGITAGIVFVVSIFVGSAYNPTAI